MGKSRRTSPPALHLRLEHLAERHRALLRELGDIGLVLRGTIGAHRTRCGKPNCRCQLNRSARHGPYHQWTRKVAGSTVSIKLNSEQAQRCREWTANMRRFDRVARKLQNLGLRAVEALRSAP